MNLVFYSLNASKKRAQQLIIAVSTQFQPVEVKIEAENLTDSNKQCEVESLVSETGYVEALSKSWIAFEANIQVPGRYKCKIQISSNSSNEVNSWIENYFDNKDDRIYNITGFMMLEKSSTNFFTISKNGKPFE